MRKTDKHKYTRQAYTEYLNELGAPQDDLRSNGGRIPDTNTKYGKWLRLNDPISYETGFQGWVREKR